MSVVQFPNRDETDTHSIKPFFNSFNSSNCSMIVIICILHYSNVIILKLDNGHSIECSLQTHACHSIAFNWNMFLHFVTLWPWPLTFWPNIKWVARTGLMIDYPCGKFGDCSFSRFGSIMRTDTQNERSILPRLLLAWVMIIFNIFSSVDELCCSVNCKIFQQCHVFLSWYNAYYYYWLVNWC